MSAAITRASEHAKITDKSAVRPPHLVLAERSPFAAPAAPTGRSNGAIRGELPAWLRGTLLRIAPSLGASGSWEPSHWFDALALAGAVDFTDASSLTLRWSLLESEIARAARSGRVEVSHFATRNQRPFWKRVLQPIPEISDNTIVNIMKWGDDVVALTESPRQWILDGDLRTTRMTAYDDGVGKGTIMLAHPVVENGAVTNLALKLGIKSEVLVYTHAEHERRRRVIGSWKTSEPPYIHSFGLSDRTAVIVAHPFTVRPTSVLWSNDGFIDHFRWQPERGTRFVLVDRATGAIEEAETDAFFAFHVVQTFDSDDAGDGGGGTITIDLLAYDDPSIIDQVRTQSLLAGLPTLSAALTRFVIHRKTRRVEKRRLSDTAFEFPQLDYERVHGRSANTVYGASLAAKGEQLVSEIVAVDTSNGQTRRFSDAGWTFGEPVFVGRPGGTREGDGVLLTVGSAARASSLFVLDPATLEPLASARFDVPFPLGLHGSFVHSAKG